MKALQRTIEKRKKNDSVFRSHFQEFEDGYREFKLGVFLWEARTQSGLTQQELAEKIGTKKTMISRLENHAENVRLSTLQKIAHALQKELKISFV
jgi:ribosome-binding protein aMBF1 (putative translation factor)